MPSLAVYQPQSPAGLSPPDVLTLALEGISGLTLRSYQSDWRHFAQWQGKHDAQDALQSLIAGGQGNAQRTLYAYRQAMLDAKFAPSTINRRIAALRYVVRATRRAGLIGWTVDVQGVPCKGIRDTRGPGSEAMQAMLAGEIDPRRHLVLRLLHDMALRRAEVVNLTLADVETGENPRLWVWGKGKHERLPLTMPPSVREAMGAWLQTRGDKPGSLIGWSYGHIANIVKQAAKQANVSTTHAHGLRHSAITTALELTNGNVAFVQKFARHSKSSTTELYNDNRTDAFGAIAAMVSNGVKQGGER